jgi:hypothetical protein
LSTEGKTILADAMTHDVKTAETHYDLERGTSNTIRATELMMLWIREAGESATVESEDSDSDVDRSPPLMMRRKRRLQDKPVPNKRCKGRRRGEGNNPDSVPKFRKFEHKWKDAEEVKRLKRALAPCIAAHVQDASQKLCDQGSNCGWPPVCGNKRQPW